MHLDYLISADYARATGGWVYNERVLLELARLGWRIERHDLPPGFPDPGPAAVQAASATVDGLPDGSLVLADQICLSPLAGALAAQTGRLLLTMIMHHPQILEASRPRVVAERLDREERAALRHMTCVIATSHSTAAKLTAEYGVAPNRLVVAEPGTDRQPLAAGSGTATANLISVGSVVPRKRHDMIVAALAGLGDLPWRLTIVGNLDRAPEHVARLRSAIDDANLQHRVVLAGERGGAELAALWHTTDIYVAAAAHEGFGMAIAEAIAHGIPVVSTPSGAVAGWLDPEAAIIVEPDDAGTMRTALHRILSEPDLRKRLGAGAAKARLALPAWDQSAAKIDAALRPMASTR